MKSISSFIKESISINERKVKFDGFIFSDICSMITNDMTDDAINALVYIANEMREIDLKVIEKATGLTDLHELDDAAYCCECIAFALQEGGIIEQVEDGYPMVETVIEELSTLPQGCTKDHFEMIFGHDKGRSAKKMLGGDYKGIFDAFCTNHLNNIANELFDADWAA